MNKLTAAVVGKLTRNLWKKGWLQLLFEKTSTLSKKKKDPAVIKIKQSNLQKEKCFARDNYFLDHSTF